MKVVINPSGLPSRMPWPYQVSSRVCKNHPNYDRSLAEFGTFNYLAIVIAGMIITAVMLETLSISFVIAVAECDLNLTTEQKGILGAVALVGIIVSSHLWGFLADTQGRRKVIIPTMLAGFGVSFVSSFTTDFATITACRFLTGFL